ncbi:MAG: molybdopterin molybdotransferase MoeA [Propionibacteriaceae bacterium]|nr:molybdopterin molybdotransferase MoeA [Propionibacteriaceae bacterium]
MAWFGRKQEEPVEVEEVEAPRLPEPPANNDAGLRSMQDHIDYLLGLVQPLRPFGMGLLEAWNQVVCEDIESLVDVPHQTTALVDGYAVRAADLIDEDGRRVETMTLAETEEGRLPLGAVRHVAAGQPVPPGATAVLPTVYVALEGDLARVFDTVKDGEYVRAAGEHLHAGEALLKEGDVLDDRSVGLLASAGIDKVFVRPRPRVVVVGSGEGLTKPGEHAAADSNFDANSFLIAAAARAAGAQVFHTVVGSNEHDELRQAVTDQLIRADLVISTTGGRREDYEAMAEVLSGIGLVDSAKVAMTPGRTQTFGLIGEDNIPMIMLPGNPVSAYVSFQAFGWPLIRKLAGADPRRPKLRGIAAHGMRSTEGQTHLLRAHVTKESGINRVSPVSRPHALTELAQANALVVLDEATAAANAGTSVYYWPLDDLI